MEGELVHATRDTIAIRRDDPEVGRVHVHFPRLGYPWTVIHVDDRDAYLATLERASIERDVEPFARFVAQRVESAMDRARPAKLRSAPGRREAAGSARSVSREEQMAAAIARVTGSRDRADVQGPAAGAAANRDRPL